MNHFESTQLKTTKSIPQPTPLPPSLGNEQLVRSMKRGGIFRMLS